jgi:pimeloyl-ACP methyl ester carboxylesterase
MTEQLSDEAWDYIQRFADQCYEDNRDTGAYISTTFVARDMLAIVEALNQGPLLNFWGASYGSFLGQTFASMFPDNVGRLFMESIMEPYDYISGLWQRNMLDFDDGTLSNFLGECLAAPHLCKLANLTQNTTASSIQSALAEVLTELYKSQEPATTGLSAFGTAFTGQPTTIYESLKRTIFQRLYYVSNFPAVDEMLSAVIQGNFSLFTTPRLSPPSPPPATSTPQPPAWLEAGAHAWYGISCIDSVLRNPSPASIRPLAAAQQATSRFADSYLPQTWICPAWHFNAPELFTGPFSANTSVGNRILFANGHHDPITPFVFAEAAQRRFPGSGLITHGGHGHGIENQPSECTDGVVGRFFLEGELPVEGTVCEPDSRAFEWAYELAAGEGGE